MRYSFFFTLLKSRLVPNVWCKGLKIRSVRIWCLWRKNGYKWANSVIGGWYVICREQFYLNLRLSSRMVSISFVHFFICLTFTPCSPSDFSVINSGLLHHRIRASWRPFFTVPVNLILVWWSYFIKVLTEILGFHLDLNLLDVLQQIFVTVTHR